MGVLRDCALLILLSGLVASPARAEPPPVPPPAIAIHIVESYKSARPITLLRMPLVDRLRRALARTDLASEHIVEHPAEGLRDIHIATDSFAEGRISDGKKRSITLEYKIRGDTHRITFEFDRTSGDWLITDLLTANGESLRKALQITP